MSDHDGARKRLVAGLTGVSDAVRRALARVPREDFVAPLDRARAYDDVALDFAFGETTPQPSFVAELVDLAAPHPGARVLEIGTGSGYAAAVLAATGATVVSLERHEALADTAAERLAPWGVTVHHADGLLGWPEGAPFDAIVASGAVQHVPTPWLRQLAEGGVLVVPVGPEEGRQELLCFTREAGRVQRRSVRYVACTALRSGRYSASAR